VFKLKETAPAEGLVGASVMKTIKIGFGVVTGLKSRVNLF
jgi:hypothetical protein